MFNFEHPKTDRTHFEQLAKFLIHYINCYATSELDDGKFKIELNLLVKATAALKKQRATPIPFQLQEPVQHLIAIPTHFDIIAHVNTDSLITGNTFFIQVSILINKKSLKIVLDACQMKTMMDETRCSWPIEPIQKILTFIKRPVFSIAGRTVRITKCL